MKISIETKKQKMDSTEFVNFADLKWIETVGKKILYGWKNVVYKTKNSIKKIAMKFVKEKKTGFLLKKDEKVTENQLENGKVQMDQKCEHIVPLKELLKMAYWNVSKIVNFAIPQFELKHTIPIIEKNFQSYGYVKHVMKKLQGDKNGAN